MNASPAPVVSTPSTGVVGTWVTTPSTHTSSPREPSVTRISSTPRDWEVEATGRDDPRFLFRELQHGHGLERGWVEGRVLLERADPGLADQSLAVERETSTAACQGRECLWREVAAQERRNVDPAHVGVEMRGVGGSPRVADGGDLRPAHLAVVEVVEPGRVLGGQDGDGHSERIYLFVEQQPVRVRAARDDLAFAAEQAQRERGEERASSSLGQTTVDAVTSEVAHDGDTRHARSLVGCRPSRTK